MRFVRCQSTRSLFRPGRGLSWAFGPSICTLARGSIACRVYSSLLRGIETILRLRLISLDLHAVVFGSPDFAMGAKVRMKLSGNDFLLFDEASTERISKGSLRTL